MKPNALPQFQTQQAGAPDLSPMTIGNRIVWKASGPNKGRGIFALVDIAEGEIIETSPVTIISKAETDLFDNDEKTGITSMIDQYLLLWQEHIKGQEYCMGHGYLMLYNHSETPTAIQKRDFDFKTLSMIAARDIKAGEEITFDYGFDEIDKPWFKVEA